MLLLGTGIFLAQQTMFGFNGLVDSNMIFTGTLQQLKQVVSGPL
jgi:hypothetical protein